MTLTPGQHLPHLQSADPADERSEWDEVLDQVACLCRKPRVVRRLAGGLTNVNLMVACEDRTVVVRVGQPGSELLSIDRHAEHLNSVAAAAAGVGAPVVDYLPAAQLLVVEFLDGRTFTDDDLRHGGHLPRVARACRQLHAGPRFVNDFNMFHLQRRYLDICDSNGFRLPPGYRDRLARAADIETAFAVRPEPTVPCNNDLLAGNFIDDGELLRHRVARARLWGLMAKYGWTLWASIQQSVSTIDFDFWSWGMEKYDRAVAEFEGEDLERLLVDVTRPD